METREIKLTLDTATRWYNGNDTELKELALTTFPELGKKALPKSWEEAKRYTNTSLSKFVAMAQLEILRDIYNDGWVADWSTTAQCKYIILFDFDRLTKQTNYQSHRFLAFKDAKTRDLFLENFSDLILTAKTLL
jgi:hypothetical protein